jgi:hypothetical protein
MKYERLMYERLMYERLMYERLMYERLMYERLMYERLMFLWSITSRSENRYLSPQIRMPQHFLLQLIPAAVIVRDPDAIY